MGGTDDELELSNDGNNEEEEEEDITNFWNPQDKNDFKLQTSNDPDSDQEDIISKKKHKKHKKNKKSIISTAGSDDNADGYDLENDVKALDLNNEQDRMEFEEAADPPVQEGAGGGGVETVSREQLEQRQNGVMLDKAGNPINPTAGAGAAVPMDTGWAPDPRHEPTHPAIFHSNDWSKENAEEEETDIPDWCFFCQCSQDKADYENDANYHKLVGYCEDNYDKVDPKTFAYNIQLFYNDHLRSYVSDGPTLWRRQTIHEHFERHITNPRFMLESLLKTHRDVALTVRDNGLVVQSIYNGRHIIQPKDYGIYCRATGQIMNLCREVLKHRDTKML